MMLSLAKANRQTEAAGFTLVETLIAFFVFALVAGGVMYGYLQTNRMAEWSAISLAAQSYASQGVEQARALKWDPYAYPPNSNTDQLLVWQNPHTNSGMNYIFDIPIKGDPTSTNFPFFVTNVVTVVNVVTNPPLRQITSKVVWTFYVTGRVYTNTSVLLRAPDQ
jgi:type II secretory pathway pseudopilin PulG